MSHHTAFPTPAKAPSQAAGKGLSAPVRGARSDAATPMPHERDQSLGQVAPQPDPMIEQAYKDLKAGQVDTDMRATPGLDAPRRARLVNTPPPDPGAGSRARVPDRRKPPPRQR